MTEIEVRAICKKHGVKYDHSDEFDAPRYLEDQDEDLRGAVVVVYSSSYGHWQLAIKADGSVSRPGDKDIKLIKNIISRLPKSIAGCPEVRRLERQIARFRASSRGRPSKPARRPRHATSRSSS